MILVFMASDKHPILNILSNIVKIIYLIEMLIFFKIFFQIKKGDFFSFLFFQKAY